MPDKKPERKTKLKKYLILSKAKKVKKDNTEEEKDEIKLYESNISLT